MIYVLIILGNDIMSLNCVGHKIAVVSVSDMRVVVMIKDRWELSEGKTPRKGKRVSYDRTPNDDAQGEESIPSSLFNGKPNEFHERRVFDLMLIPLLFWCLHYHHLSSSYTSPSSYIFLVYLPRDSGWYGQRIETVIKTRNNRVKQDEKFSLRMSSTAYFESVSFMLLLCLFLYLLYLLLDFCSPVVVEMDASLLLLHSLLHHHCCMYSNMNGKSWKLSSSSTPSIPFLPHSHLVLEKRA